MFEGSGKNPISRVKRSYFDWSQMNNKQRLVVTCDDYGSITIWNLLMLILKLDVGFYLQDLDLGSSSAYLCKSINGHLLHQFQSLLYLELTKHMIRFQQVGDVQLQFKAQLVYLDPSFWGNLKTNLMLNLSHIFHLLSWPNTVIIDQDLCIQFNASVKKRKHKMMVKVYSVWLFYSNEAICTFGFKFFLLFMIYIKRRKNLYWLWSVFK